MDSILKQLTDRATGIRRRDPFASGHDYLDIDCKTTGRERDGFQEEWELSANLSVCFWANRAQYQRARGIAEQALVAFLYAEILGDLAQLRLHVSDGDRDACHRVISIIEHKLKG